MGSLFELGLDSFIISVRFQLTVCSTSDNIPHAKSISGGQSAPSPDNEKGSRDQNREVEKISQVGREHDDRKGDGASASGSSARSLWFDDKTKEIGAKPGSTGTVGGWVFVRTKTGHLRKRKSNRDSVSKLHPSDSEQF
jgi:hypothetical protein